MKTEYRFLPYDTVVIGSGAAAFNAADWLYDLGRRNFALLTEGVGMGTSRNTGSDKQTYYKLSIGPDGSDSVAEMAQTLFDGGGVDGRIALAEAANSLRCFMKLANLGVDFPTDRYGRYVGYKTDHDPRQRATSAGPLTSRDMTEALEASVRRKGVPILDHLTAFRIYQAENRVRGILCLDRAAAAENRLGLVVIAANHVIWCTGGPSACYRNVVYPSSQTGMTGALLGAGAKGANLQEWQYGLASTKFRWNVSGTYQQVLPRYVSVDAQGNRREFLTDYGMSPAEAVNMVFLKGYQWPFDAAKKDASSRVDLCVYEETAVKGRKVFLDFRKNPAGLAEGFQNLSEEAYRYLKNSGALLATPIERLKKMNPLAVRLYRDHSINLETDLLEISVCAQHHNGGIQVDPNWETAVEELYVAGEAAGTFGVHRPGGSALNSTQVGSMRAAQHIAWTSEEARPDTSGWPDPPERLAAEAAEELSGMVGRKDNVSAVREKLQTGMSRAAAQVRDLAGIAGLKRELDAYRVPFREKMGVSDFRRLPLLVKTYDMIVTQSAVLDAMERAAEIFGSRGGALVRGRDGAVLPPKSAGRNVRLVTAEKDGGFSTTAEDVPTVPQENEWFETVWEEHRKYRRPKIVRDRSQNGNGTTKTEKGVKR
ncbi:MAG: FAD-binding protein [Oscillospiraceae bacterium]|jgi:succinate dehydrogenase/fumarate reductase flavoprotein subunit|nr:FAD-binding protein [Oscillospiraceae bacterium]MCI2035508.1 FAD-binding protein [Oscillospiraceae bacterium]